MKKMLTLILCVLMAMSLVLPASAVSTVKVKSIKLDKGSISLKVGKTYSLKVTFSPANTTQKSVKFSSDNAGVATVDGKGKITAVKVGKAVITAKSASSSKILAKCTVNVSQITVAGVVFQDDQFMKTLTQGYQDAAKAAGVKCMTGNTDNDQGKEVELINTYIAQKVDGIAIAPRDPQTSEPSLRTANSKGIKIAITNMDLSSAPYIVGGYTSDSFQIGEGVGKAAAKFINDKLGGKAKIAILQFKSQVPAQSKARVDGFKSALKDIAGAEYVADQDAWLADKAVGVAGDMLTANKDINVIFAANDGGTKGACAAVKNAGLAGKVFVFGIDVDQQVIDLIKSPDNILQAANGQDPYTMGYKAMETLINAIMGKDVSATKGKTIIVSGKLVDRTDPSSYK